MCRGGGRRGTNFRKRLIHRGFLWDSWSVSCTGSRCEEGSAFSLACCTHTWRIMAAAAVSSAASEASKHTMSQRIEPNPQRISEASFPCPSQQVGATGSTSTRAVAIGWAQSEDFQSWFIRTPVRGRCAASRDTFCCRNLHPVPETPVFHSYEVRAAALPAPSTARARS